MDKVKSLRQAQLKLLKSKKWNNPKYWAAFILYGESI
ncbi:MAG: CHAT domain-containing protein [bacterium]|nr:MAG: CHAT domain-containing protein [bacterium]